METKNTLEVTSAPLPQGRKGQRKGPQKPRERVEEKPGSPALCRGQVLNGDTWEPSLADGTWPMCGLRPN